MADPQTKLDDLISEVDRKVREEVDSELQPLLNQLAKTVSSIEKVVNSVSGRKKAAIAASTSEAPAAKKKGPGRPAKKTAAKKAKGGKGGKGGKRAPRGALEAAIRDALKSKPGLKIAEIRDEVLKDSNFKGRDPKGIYTQASQALSRMSDVKKKDKKYSLK